MADKKRFTIGGNGGGGRFSLATWKTPTKTSIGRPGTNLRTPAQRADVRFSIGVPQSSRRTSHFGAKGLGNNQGQKDLSKPAQIAMSRKIYDFLCDIEKGESPIPEENILSPSTSKDFVLIFELIYECISPEYELHDKRIVDEIPRIFAGLGYPWPIKQSTMQTVVVPHIWPNLLHALCWLIDFVKLALSVKDPGTQILLAGDDTSGAISSYRYSWFSQQYQYCRTNKVDYRSVNYSELKRPELMLWFENQEDLETQIRASEINLQTLEKEIMDMRNEPSLENELKAKIRTIEEDMDKALAYQHNLKQEEKATASHKKAAEEEYNAVKEEIVLVQNKLAEMKAAIAAQESERNISASAARIILSEHENNLLHIREMQGEMDILSKESWLNQPKVNELFAQLHSRFRKLVNSLRTIRNDIGGEGTSIDVDAIRDIKELHVCISNDVRREIQMLRADLEQEIGNMKQEINTVETKRRQLVNSTEMEVEKLTERQRRRHRISLEHQQETEEAKNERRHLSQLIERLENEKQSFLQRKRGMAAMEQELVVVSKELEDTERSWKAAVSEFESSVLNKVAVAAKSLEHMQKSMADMERSMIKLASCDYRSQFDL